MRGYIFRLLPILSLFFLLVTGMGGAFSADGTRKLRIGTDHWPPYEFVHTDPLTGSRQVRGFCTQVVLAVLKRMGVEVEDLSVFPWSRVESELAQGKLDVIYSSSYSDKRATFALFPREPLLEAPWVIFAHKDMADDIQFRNFEDLAKYKFGVVNNYSYTEEFWQFLRERGQFEPVNFDELNFKKLALKRIDLVVSELRNGLHLVKQLKLQRKVTVLPGPPIKVAGLYVIFSKKTVGQVFVDEFSLRLKEYKQTEEYRMLLQELMGGKNSSSF